ncbi:MAG: acetate--CoA ligase family protein [Thermodesulfobacteriota bacterium]
MKKEHAMTAKSFLHNLMHPKSIAIVGASNNPMKMGTMHALSILKDGFSGTLYPVHPTETEVLGQKAWQSPHDLPETPDLAIFVLPAKHLPPLFEDFGKIGTQNAIVITAGFKETGEDGAEQERQLVEIARQYGMRFIGPNCMGMINHAISLNTTVTPLTGPAGKLGMVSQSGTYVAQAIDYLEKRGIHFSKAVSVGNEADVNIIDVLEYLGEDEETRAIALYIETIRDVPRFLEVAAKITPHKPVIAQYVGGSEAGARAGKSHTGAMAGQEPLYNGLFKQAGVIRVHSVEDLYGLGWALANQPRLRGNRIAIITNSGGPGSAIADTLEACGCTVPPFSEKLEQQIRPLVPAHAPCGNPVDLTFIVDMRVMTDDIFEMVMKSGEVDGVVIHGAMNTGFLKAIFPHVSALMPDMTLEDLLAQSRRDLSKSIGLPHDYGVPVTVSSFFDREDQYTREYQDNGIPVFDAPEKAARAMATLVAYNKIRRRHAHERPAIPKANETARKIIDDARQNGQHSLDEYGAKQLLKTYGIPVPDERLAESADQAAAAAATIGFPVAIKACRADLLHKTEGGLVHLNITDEAGARKSFDAIQNAAEMPVPVIVGQMVSGSREFLAGLIHDPQFGHCVAFGVGGIFTEALNDVTYRVAPIGDTAAEEMIADIKNTKLLAPLRGMPAVHTAELADLLQKISMIGMIHNEIQEIDINPVLISGSSPVAVDALIVLAG